MLEVPQRAWEKTGLGVGRSGFLALLISVFEMYVFVSTLKTVFFLLHRKFA